MSNTQQAILDYEKMLLSASEYSGNRESKKKIFSASMLGSEMLPIYLKFFHGSEKQKKFEANTVGSIYQLGVDSAADKWNEKFIPQYENAKRLTYELSNGWIFSGEMDQIDHINKVIFDNKVVTSTAISKVKSEGKNNGYALQMAGYQLLVYKDLEARGLKPEVYPVVLPMVDKKFSHYGNNKYETLNFIKPDIFSIKELERILVDKTDLLQEYIDAEMEPAQCVDLWWYGFKGKPKRKMKCLFYCDQSKNCKHLTDHNVMKNLLEQL